MEQHCSLQLVPFGKASSTSSGFTCQHGQKECRGNMIMSCALARLPAGRQQLDFTSCFMGDPNSGGPSCCEKSGLQWTEIENCLTSGEGRTLQLEAEKASYPISRSRFVPTIVINGKYKANDQSDAVGGNFQQLMCRYNRNIGYCQ